MSGWIYVLELRPTNCIKVGQTTNLPQRMAAHLGNAMTYGFTVARSANIAVTDPEQAEAEMLASLREHPRVQTIRGKETFTGISFDAAVKVMNRCGRPTRKAVAPTPEPPVETDHLLAIRKVLKEPREYIRDVLPRLRERNPATYAAWNQARLIEELEDTWGVPVRTLKGYRVVHAADVEIAQSTTSG